MGRMAELAALPGNDFSATEVLQEERVFSVFETKQPLKQEGEIVGVEALARGKTREGRIIPPDQLIANAIAEDQLRQLHRVLTQQSVEFAYESNIPVSINLHPDLLKCDDIVEELADIVESANVPEEHISVELLETTTKNRLKKGKTAIQKLSGRQPLANGKTVRFETAADDYPEKNARRVYRRIRRYARPTIKVDWKTTRSLLHEDRQHWAAQRIKDVAHCGRKAAKVIFEGVEPGEQDLRQRIEQLIKGIITPDKAQVQVGRPETADAMKRILRGEQAIERH